MEVNKEEAMRCLSIAHRHRTSSNLPSALKFARKSVSLYSTPEGEAMITIVEKEISISESKSGSSPEASTSNGPGTPNGGPSTPSTPNGTSARASGVEEHLSSAHARRHHPEETGKKREYTVKQMEVVTRVKKCKHHEYYEILSVERTCTENDVKKAYKKLALALHPDKNGAPGADEAFKMVSKAFQILSDEDMRAAFDANPHLDPTQRGGGGGGGMSSRGGFPAGFSNGGFEGEINPEDLFNMFFGGGGGGYGGQANVFTFGGPNGFQAHYARPRRARQNATQEESSPLLALFPILILVIFALVSILPGILNPSDPEPGYSFEPSNQHAMGRKTFARKVPYWVNQKEWEGSAIWNNVPEERRDSPNPAIFSTKVKMFERGVESVYINQLHSECDSFNARIHQEISNEAGIFGIGANYERIRELRAEKSPSCERLRDWGLLNSNANNKRVGMW